MEALPILSKNYLTAVRAGWWQKMSRPLTVSTSVHYNSNSLTTTLVSDTARNYTTFQLHTKRKTLCEDK